MRAVLSAALRFRLLLIGIAAGLIVLGAISLRQMPRDVVPELASGPVLEVQTEALGLSSQEVEQYVTVPMENNLLDGIMDVWDVRSQSVPGLSTVDLYFEPGTTVLHARQLVEERLTNAFSLPNVSKPPQLIQPLSSSSRALMVGLSSTKLDPLYLSYLARWVVKPRLSGVPGVANVAIFGQKDWQMQVQVNPATLAAHGVTLSQIIDTAGNSQLVSPLSYLEGSAPGTGGFLDGPNQRLEIRPILPLGVPKNLASVPVSDAPGRLPLGAVASVVRGHQPMIGDAVAGNGSSLVLLIQKLPGASVSGVTTGVERALNDLRPSLGPVHIDTSFFRPASYASAASHNLTIALLIGAALGLIAMTALLLGARALFVTAVSVALSLLGALLALQALGYSINALVVLGLLLASAVLVDDAVGQTYELVRRLRERRAAGGPLPLGSLLLEAVGQFRRPLGYATVLVLVVVAPVFFAKGLSATFIHPMVLAFALAVIASLAVSLTFGPALASVLFERGVPYGRGAALAIRLRAAYEQGVQRVFAIPRSALAAVLLLGLAGAVALPFVSEPSPPTFKDRNLIVSWQGPAGASLSEMDRITRRAVAQLRAVPSVADVAATLGRAVSADRIVDTNSGQIYVALRQSADYGQAVAAVRSTVEEFPGMQASVGTYESQVMSGVLTGAPRQVDVRVYGENFTTLRALGARVQQAMGSVSGLGPAGVQLSGQQPNIEVAVNDNKALAAGVLPGDARRQASTLVSGLTVGNFFQDQAVFDVVVIGTPSVRSSVDTIRNLLIDTGGGGHVPLGQIAKVTVKPDPIDIQHEALSRYVDVIAPVMNGSVSSIQAAVQKRLGAMQFPLAYHAEIVGGTPNDPTSHLAFLSYVLAAAIAVLLLLQAALGSWRLAAMLFLALPAALSGGVIVAVAGRQLSSLGAVAGLLAVYAFAARQGLLQLVGIRRLQTLEASRLTPALVARAAAQRLVPSVGAALVADAVLLPFLILGDVAGNELTHAAAAVIMGGLVTATLLTVIVLPALCLWVGSPAPDSAEELEYELVLRPKEPSVMSS